MKNFTVVLVLVMTTIMALPALSQTKDEKKQLRNIQKEIKKSSKLILSMESSGFSDRVADEKLWLDSLDKMRKKIILGYIGAEVPKEISKEEVKKRNRSFIIRRQEIVLKNVTSSSLSTADSKGYKVIIGNDYSSTISFQIKGMNGGGSTSVLLEPRKKEEIYLLPGEYQVLFFKGNVPIGGGAVLSVDGTERIFKGEKCFGYVYMPQR